MPARLCPPRFLARLSIDRVLLLAYGEMGIYWARLCRLPRCDWWTSRRPLVLAYLLTTVYLAASPGISLVRESLDVIDSVAMSSSFGGFFFLSFLNLIPRRKERDCSFVKPRPSQPSSTALDHDMMLWL